jgi:hypothetical protein
MLSLDTCKQLLGPELRLTGDAMRDAGGKGGCQEDSGHPGFWTPAERGAREGKKDLRI